MQQGSAGGQHGINDEDGAPGEVLRQRLQVRHGLVGFFIARHANEADLGIWNHRQGGIHHAEPGANDGHDDGWILQAGALCCGNRGFASEVFYRQIAGGFIYEHGSQVLERSAKSGVITARIAHQGQAGSGKRVVYDVDIHAHYFKLFGNHLGHWPVQ